MPIRAVVFDLDGTITEPYFDFDAIREEIGLEKNGEPILEAMEKMTPARGNVRSVFCTITSNVPWRLPG